MKTIIKFTLGSLLAGASVLIPLMWGFRFWTMALSIAFFLCSIPCLTLEREEDVR